MPTRFCHLNQFKECCCQCKYQVKLHCHPWNDREWFKAGMDEFVAWGCASFYEIKKVETVPLELDDGIGRIVINDAGHGLCEMFSKRGRKSKHEEA